MSYLGLLCWGFWNRFQQASCAYLTTKHLSPQAQSVNYMYCPCQENRTVIAKCELHHSQLKAAWVLAIFFKPLSPTCQFEVKWNPTWHLWESSFFHYKLEQKGSWHKGAHETYLDRNAVCWTSSMSSFFHTNEEYMCPKNKSPKEKESLPKETNNFMSNLLTKF